MAEETKSPTSLVAAPSSTNTLEVSQGSNDRFNLFNKRSYEDTYVSNKAADGYYSGAEVSVYFNTVFVPDVSSLQFSGKPMDAPIFGYSQEQWNALTKGTYMVQGQLTINFTENGYLNKVLRTVWNELAIDTDFDNFKSEVTQNERYDRAVDVLLSKDSLNKRFSDVRNAASVMRENLWKSQDTSSQFVYRPDQVSSVAMYDDNGKRQTPPLNIIIIYGNPNGKHTTKKLSDVRFLECGQTINNDGTPIQEVYSFVARDMDNPETVIGFAPFAAAPKQTTFNLDNFIDYMADSLYTYIMQRDTIENFYDMKFLYRPDSVMCSRLETNNEIAMYKGKEAIGINLFSMFNISLDYHKQEKIGIYAGNTSDLKKTVRYHCLNKVVNLISTIGDSYTEADANMMHQHFIRSYAADVLNTISYVNPYVPVRSTRIITHVTPQPASHVTNGFMKSAVVRRDGWTFKEREAVPLTYAMLPFERFCIFETGVRDEYDFTVNVSGDSSKSRAIFNRSNRTVFDNFVEETPNILFELLSVDAYSPFEQSPELCQTHFSSLYGARLNDVKNYLYKSDGTKSDDWRGMNCVYMVPDEYSMARQVITKDETGTLKNTTYQYETIYDDQKNPMTNSIVTFDDISVNDDYKFKCLRKNKMTGEFEESLNFPLPVGLWKDKLTNTTHFGVAVVIDDYPAVYGKDLEISTNGANGTFTVKLLKAPVYISKNSKVTFILVDTDSVNPISYKPELTNTYLYEQMNILKKAGADAYVLRPKDKSDINTPYVKYIVDQENSKLDIKEVQKLRYSKFMATVAVPAFGYTTSAFTKRTIKKYIQNMYVFNDMWQFKFDMQEFFAYMYEDLKVIKDNNPGVIENMDYTPMLERFRLRFLNNLQNKIIPYYMDIRLAGTYHRDILVTGMTDTHPAAVIENFVKTGVHINEDAALKKYSNFKVSYDTININLNNTKTPVCFTLNVPKLLHREFYAAKQIEGGNTPFFYTDGEESDYHKSFMTFNYKPSALHTYHMGIMDMLNVVNKELIKAGKLRGKETSMMKEFYNLFASSARIALGDTDISGNYKVSIYYNRSTKKFAYLCTHDSSKAVSPDKDLAAAATTAMPSGLVETKRSNEESTAANKEIVFMFQTEQGSDKPVQAMASQTLEAGIGHNALVTNVAGNDVVLVNQTTVAINAADARVYDMNKTEYLYNIPFGYDSVNHTIDAFNLTLDPATGTYKKDSESDAGKVHKTVDDDEAYNNIARVCTLNNIDDHSIGNFVAIYDKYFGTNPTAPSYDMAVSVAMTYWLWSVGLSNTYGPAYYLWKYYIDLGLKKIHKIDLTSNDDESESIIVATRNIMMMLDEIKLLCSFKPTSPIDPV